MKKEIIGIVAEFNPLHNGHKKLIDYVKKENKNSNIVIVMSGQFVQRGELAIYDKWIRAMEAIKNGGDLVVEIPPYFVLNNANIFAKKSVEILHKYKVSKIYFGTENLEIPEIKNIANKILKNETKLESLKKETHSLPKAFEKFLKRKINPNDTLGICYVLESKKMGLKIKFKRIKREVNKVYTSASLIRKDIYKNKKNKKSLIQNIKKTRNIDNYSELILGKILLSESSNVAIKYLVNILSTKKFSTFSELINYSANKNFTKAKLRRESLKFVLNLNKGEKEIILAGSEDGKEILKNIDDYFFRHTKENIDNYKIEKFISLKEGNLKDNLSKKTIWLN